MVDVVLVEDDVALRNSLADCLTIMGHRVTEAGDAVQLYQLMADRSFEVAVIDINLPYHDGYSIARHLSNQADVGIIVTTARDAIADRVQGYNNGADIYMTKPVEPEELSAAITGLALKRQAARTPGSKPLPVWTYTARTHALRSPGDRCLRLTRREALFFEHLARDAQPVTFRPALFATFGDENSAASSRKLDAMVCRLRARVLKETDQSLPVSTVQGVGFSLSATVDIA